MWNNVESSLFFPSIHTLIKYLLQRRFDSFHSPCTKAVLCQTMIAKHPKKAKMTKKFNNKYTKKWNTKQLYSICYMFNYLFENTASCQSFTPSTSLLRTTKAFKNMYFVCRQCVHPAARSSWSRGWGKTGSSSFCWDCSWLWSAGSWTTPSPSAKKVGKRRRGAA